jgi:hypothetical protein
VTTVPVTLPFLAGHVSHAKGKGFDVHAVSSPGEPLDEFARDIRIEAHAVVMPLGSRRWSTSRRCGGSCESPGSSTDCLWIAHTPKGVSWR